MTVIHWQTHKTDGGYEFSVSRIAYQVPTVELKRGVCSSRARAVRLGKAWKMYYQAEQLKRATLALSTLGTMLSDMPMPAVHNVINHALSRG